MRTLKYAILGLLKRGPKTGYDISKEFQQDLGNFWSASHSQIYPELNKLNKEGLIEYEVVIQGELMEKKLYRITPKGIDALVEWLPHDEPLPPTQKEKFRLRVYLMDSISDEDTNKLFKSQYRQVKKRLEIYEFNMQRFKGEDPKDLDKVRLGDYMLLRGAIMRDQMLMAWLEECMGLLPGGME